MSVRIAVVQFQITHQKREENFRRMEEFVQQASRKGAQVIVFPEDCITGSIFGDRSKLDTTHIAREMFRRLARTHRLDIVTGSVMEGTSEGNFNTSYYINAAGDVLGTYRKNHLYPSERTFLSAGTDVPVFETAYGRAGIVICWDMLFSEIFQRMKDQGVQIIYCPSYWYREIAETMASYNHRSEEQLLDALCLTRSVEAKVALVYCNAAGVMKNPNGSVDTLIGHSQITLPVLGAVKKLRHHREGMFIQEIYLDSLLQSAEIYHA